MLLDDLSNENAKYTFARQRKQKTIGHIQLGHTIQMQCEATTCSLSTQSHNGFIFEDVLSLKFVLIENAILTMVTRGTESGLHSVDEHHLSPVGVHPLNC